MSLSVYLTVPGSINISTGIFIREDGQTKEITREEWNKKFPDEKPYYAESVDETVWSGNVTHNLGVMATHAKVYKYLWRHEELDIKIARQLIGPLTIGLTVLKGDPIEFRKFNPDNGWGTYEILIEFIEEYISACKQYPDAEVSSWR